MDKNIDCLFVCRGNTFRSRMSEAIALSLGLDLNIKSAGIDSESSDESVQPYAVYATSYFGVEQYLSQDKIQLTQELIDSSKYVVFVTPTVYEDSKEKWNVEDPIIWNVPDIDPKKIEAESEQQKDEIIKARALEAYKKLEGLIKELLLV